MGVVSWTWRHTGAISWISASFLFLPRSAWCVRHPCTLCMQSCVCACYPCLRWALHRERSTTVHFHPFSLMWDYSIWHELVLVSYFIIFPDMLELFHASIQCWLYKRQFFFVYFKYKLLHVTNCILRGSYYLLQSHNFIFMNLVWTLFIHRMESLTGDRTG